MRKSTKLIVFLTAFILIFAVFAACQNNNNEEDKTLPVITVSGVPESGYAGRAVSLPAATAEDNKDGSLSDSVLLTVTGLKADGTAAREFLNKVSASKENTFTPIAAITKYTIRYFVTDAAGNTGEKVFDFTLTADTEAPVITITQSGFDASKGITGSDINGFTLPTAMGTDNPGNADITSDIKVLIKNGTETISYDKYTADTKQLIAGDYTVEYSLADGSKNNAETVSFPLKIVAEDKNGINLLNGNYNGKTISLGKYAAFNEFAELKIGKNSESMDSDMSTATLKTMKFSDQYIGMTVNIDPSPASGGESYYSINYINSKNKNLYTPDGTEGVWATGIQLRFTSSSTYIVFGETGNLVSDSATTAGFQDGKDHTVFFKFEKTGESAKAANAKLILKVWIDALPTAEPTLYAEMVSAEKDSTGGKMAAADFEETWNNPQGFLNFAAHSEKKGSNGKYDDDVMRVKALTVYSADEETFGTDITAPVVSVENPAVRYVINEKITFSEASITDAKDGALTVNMYLVKPDGTKVVLDSEKREFTPSENGIYTLVYFANDKNNVPGYVKFSFKVTPPDYEAPVLALSSEANISATVGQEFALPTFTVTDNLDTSVSESVVLKVVGPESSDNLFELDYVYSYTLYAVGEYKFIYISTDFADNETRKEIIVNVSGAKTGDLISSFSNYSETNDSVTLGDGQSTVYLGQRIYSEKVSTVINMGNNDGLLLIQLRGPEYDKSWPKGLILSIAGDKITVYGGGINQWGLGQFENPFYDIKNIRYDVKFEYSITTENIGGIDYARIRIWFNEQELNVVTSYYQYETSGGLVNYSLDAEELAEFSGSSVEGGGLFCTISEIPAKYSLDASFPIISAVNGRKVSILEYRIDGSALETPWVSPTKPRGVDLPAFSQTGATSLVTEDGAVMNVGDNGVKKLTTGQKIVSQTEKKIVIESIVAKMQFVAKTEGTSPDYKTNNNFTMLRLLGPVATGQWSTSGISLAFYQTNSPEIALAIGEGNYIAWIDYGSKLYTDWQAGNEMLIKTGVSYELDSDGYVENVNISLYVGTQTESGITWEDAGLYLWNPPDGVTMEGGQTNTVSVSAAILGSDTIASNGLSIFGRGDTGDGNDNANYYVKVFYAKADEE